MVSLLQHEMTAHVRFGSWPCKNSNAHCARSNILEKLRVLRIDDSSNKRMDAVLENCIFYIFPMYEFLHNQGHSRLFRRPESWPVSIRLHQRDPIEKSRRMPAPM